MLAFEERELPLRRSLVADIGPNLSDQKRHQLELRLNHYRPVALIFADQGREREITRSLRKMSVFNPIPSRMGDWGDGAKTKNIPVQRVIEDPVFKKSHQSYLLQLADVVAYSLLKREVAPTPHVKRYDIHKMFEKHLHGVCWKDASPKDPLGIVRK